MNNKLVELEVTVKYIIKNYIDEMKVDVVDINYDLIKDLEFKK